MSVDNRTTLNDCSATTGWTGDDSVSVTSDTGNFYEGGSALSTQLSDSDEHMYTTSIGGTRDLSDAQVWMLIKDNLGDTLANGGVKLVLHDGTDRIGYEIGGNDATGLQLSIFFNAYRLDTTSLPSGFFVFAGVEANLTFGSITGVGYGSLHLAKAVGAIDNVFMDRFSFITNGSPALTINAGTSGTPETLADVAADDVTNGWGLVANLKGSVFDIFCSTEWGDSGTADSYFSQTDSQIFLIGSDLGAGHFDMSLIANSTGVNSFVLDNCIIVNIGTAANWILDPANHDIMKISNTQFVDNGTFTFPVQDAGDKFVQDTSFVNCGQVDPSTIDMDRVSFVGSTDANGALLLDEATASNMSDMSYTSDGTGHAIHVRPTGAGPFTYTFDNWTFSGYANDAGTATDRVAYIDPVTSSADITINITNGGDSPSIREAAGYTGTVTINNTVTVTIHVQDEDEVAIENAQVYIQKSSPTAFTSGAGNNAADADLVVTQTIDGDLPQTGWLNVLDLSTSLTLPYRYGSHDGANTFTLLAELTGSATSTGSSTSLISTSTNFLTADIEEGDTIRNTTDGSYAVVDEIVDADNITTSPLIGGSDDTWESSDGFSVHRLATTLISGTDPIDIPLLNAQSDSGGDVSLSYAYSGDLAIITRVRYSPSSGTKYRVGKGSGTIVNSGFSATVTLSEDTVAI